MASRNTITFTSKDEDWLRNKPKTWREKMEEKRQKLRNKGKKKKASPSRLQEQQLRTPIVPGVQTFLTQDSKEGLPDGTGQEKPSLSPLPETATPGGAGREIGTFSYNGPSADSDIKPRTLGIPGEQYGHPTNVLNNYITRRTIESMVSRVAARHKTRVAATFKLDVGMPVLYGKYKNKKGIIKGFKTGPKGDPIVVVDQVPNPTGRKQPKEIKLFRIRYDRERAEGSSEAKKAAVRKMVGAYGAPMPTRQRRQPPLDRRKDNRNYRRHPQRKRENKRRYHTKCKRNRNCMRRRELYRENSKRFKRRPPGMSLSAGSIILYDQENPSNNEIKQPGPDVNYRAQGPATYEFQTDDRMGEPWGGGEPGNQTDNVPPLSNRVIPDSMKETLYNNMTYIKASASSDARELTKQVRTVLTPDLLKPQFRKKVEGGANPMTGHCYVASEAMYHMLGGKAEGYKPMALNMGDCVHWWLRGPGGEIIDPTFDQFDRPVPYGKGRGKGFLTRQPSARAQAVIDRVDRKYRKARSKSAATFNDLFNNTEAIVIQRSGPMKVKGYRFSPKQGFWTFKVTGSDGHVYTVRVKGVKKGNVKQLAKAQVKISCSCPYWRWQGPEHWAKQNGYLYGRPRGTASTPVIRDPASTHWMCKHVAATLNQARKYRFSADSLSWWQDAMIYPEGASPDPKRVVAMWRVQ